MVEINAAVYYIYAIRITHVYCLYVHMCIVDMDNNNNNMMVMLEMDRGAVINRVMG